MDGATLKSNKVGRCLLCLGHDVIEWLHSGLEITLSILRLHFFDGLGSDPVCSRVLPFRSGNQRTPLQRCNQRPVFVNAVQADDVAQTQLVPGLIGQWMCCLPVLLKNADQYAQSV